MARPLRIEYPGAVYHITSRGNAQQDIFLDADDYLDFQDVLCSVVRRFNWLIHAYCLMGNHYHLLVETPDGNLSTGMRQLNGVYTQRFNRKRSRVGHVMQGRFKAILVDKESYLAELCRYIVLNPVKAGIKKRPDQWRWSSYLMTAGKGEGFACLTVDWLLSQFAKTRKVAQEKYIEFVQSGIDVPSPWKNLSGQALLGDDAFMERMKPLLDDKDMIQEIPKSQRYSARPPIEKILKLGKQKKATIESVYKAHVVYGYMLKDIAGVLGLHYTTVSAMVSKAERESKN